MIFSGEFKGMEYTKGFTYKPQVVQEELISQTSNSQL